MHEENNQATLESLLSTLSTTICRSNCGGNAQCAYAVFANVL